MKTDAASGEPPYLQIAAYLRKQIGDGVLREGERVPSARQLVKDWRVALNTANNVLRTLKAEGLTEAHATGTVVASRQKLTAQDRISAGRRTGKIYPANERAEIRAAGLTPADAQVADALGVEVGTPVIRRCRVTFNTDTVPAQPVSASTSWFDGALAAPAPALLIKERIRSGTPRYIEEQTGRLGVTGRDQLTAGTATDFEATELELSPGMSIQRGRNWIYDQDGQVLEFGESISVPGRWSTYQYPIYQTKELEWN